MQYLELISNAIKELLVRSIELLLGQHWYIIKVIEWIISISNLAIGLLLLNKMKAYKEEKSSDELYNPNDFKIIEYEIILTFRK
jgi:hypothetical protein